MLKKILAVFLLLVTQAHAENLAPPPVTAFASLPEIEQLTLSPSGSYFAFLRTMEGKTYLVMRAAKGDDVHVLLDSDEKYRIAQFYWVNDERLLVSIYYPDYRNATDTTEGRLLAINRDGTEVKADFSNPDSFGFDGISHIPQYQNRLVSLLPGDPRHVLIQLDVHEQNHPDVYKVDIYSGEKTIVQRHWNGVTDWLADLDGKVRLGIAISGTEIRIIAKAAGSDDWRTLADYDGLKERGIFPLSFGSDPDQLFVKQIYQGRQAIFKLNLAKPDAAAELVASDLHYDISLLRASGPTGGVYYSADEERAIYWDDDARILQQRIDHALPDRSNRIEGSTDDGLWDIVSSENSIHPAELYLMNEKTSNLRALNNTYPRLDPARMAAPRRITLKARDGLLLNGYLSVPPGSQIKSFPVIVFPHGGPTARDIDGFNYWTQFFISRGWAVLQVNYRGSGGYGTEFEAAGFKRWGLEMQNDITDSVRWLIDAGTADPKKICIVGASYGGYATLMGISTTPDLYRCAVSFAGLSNLRSFLSSQSHYTNYELSVESQLGGWWHDRKRLRETSPVNLVSTIRTPLLLVHGAQDRRVPVEQSREMADALKGADFKDYRYLELPNADHHLSREEDRIRLFTEMETFLDKYLN